MKLLAQVVGWPRSSRPRLALQAGSPGSHAEVLPAGRDEAAFGRGDAAKEGACCDGCVWLVCGLKAFAPVLTHRTPFLAVAALRKTAAREKFFVVGFRRRVVGFGRRCRSLFGRARRRLGSGFHRSKHHRCLDRARASSKLQAWSRKMATRRMLAQEKEVAKKFGMRHRLYRREVARHFKGRLLAATRGTKSKFI